MKEEFTQLLINLILRYRITNWVSGAHPTNWGLITTKVAEIFLVVRG